MKGTALKTCLVTFSLCLVWALGTSSVHAASLNDLEYRREYLLTVIDTYTVTQLPEQANANLVALRQKVAHARTLAELDRLARSLKQLRSQDAARERAKTLLLKELRNFESTTLDRAETRAALIRRQIEKRQSKNRNQEQALEILNDAEMQIVGIQMSLQTLIATSTASPAATLDVSQARLDLAGLKSDLKHAYSTLESALKKMR